MKIWAFRKGSKDYSLFCFVFNWEIFIPCFPKASFLDALWSEIMNDVLDMEHSPENRSFIRGILA